jgi:organizing structure protein 2
MPRWPAVLPASRCAEPLLAWLEQVHTDFGQPKKSIYDKSDNETLVQPQATRQAIPTPSRPRAGRLTESLEAQIARARLFLHARVAATETVVDNALTSFFNLETNLTSTIAGLAPPPQSGERLMPGSVYVLVAAMTGSIISRNRNILLRGLGPVAAGIGAGWLILPATMGNVGDLLWKYEERFPVVAQSHLTTRATFQKAWDSARLHTTSAGRLVDEKLGEGRNIIEGWVRQAK